jgi:hypothetical protein
MLLTINSDANFGPLVYNFSKFDLPKLIYEILVNAGLDIGSCGRPSIEGGGKVGAQVPGTVYL